MRALLWTIVGVVIVVGFAMYGYNATPTDQWTPRKRYVESVISYGSLGAGAVLCVGSAVWLLLRALRRRQRFLWACVASTAVALVSAAVPGALMMAASRLSSEDDSLFSGDSGGYLIVMTILMLWITGITIVAFPACYYVFRSARKA